MPKKEMIQLDPKVRAVLDRKGYYPTIKLAEGAFGQVFKGTKKDKETGKESLTAVKVMDLDKCEELVKVKFIPRELQALKEVHHPNIIGIFDMFQMGGKIYIFMEFAGNGTVADVLGKEGALSESRTRKWFKEMMEALYFMHSEKSIAHRDLKTENVLFDAKMVTKLSDFGFAKEVVDGALSSTFCGTQPYKSPQLICHERYSPFEADVWAMGVVLFFMLNNRYAFPSFTDKKVLLKEQKESAYKKRFIPGVDFSADVRDLLKRLLTVNPSSRISMEDAVKHRWFKR